MGEFYGITGIDHGIDMSSQIFQMWFWGIPLVYTLLVGLFRVMGLWDFKTRKGGRTSDILAFELCALVSVTYLGVAGLVAMFDLYGVEESAKLSAYMFYAKSTFVEDHLIYPMVTFQGWNTFLCLFVPDLRNPLMMGHHTFTALLGYFGLNPYLHGAGLFFFGVAELSNVPLTVYDIFKYTKPAGYQEKYPKLFELTKVSFAVSFIVLRLIIWPIKSWIFWIGSIELLQSGKAHSQFVVGFFLVANIFLTFLQFMWGWQIISMILPGAAEKKVVQGKRGSKKTR